MDKAFDDVRKFMELGEQEIGATPKLEKPEGEVEVTLIAAGRQCVAFADVFKKQEGVLALRARLMLEELGETLLALAEGDIEEVADGLADLDYVTIGTALALGIDHRDVWKEVQRSNLAKFVDGKRYKDEHGKVTKPPGWTPPDIKSVLANQKPLL